jgi:hypothetical protein
MNALFSVSLTKLSFEAGINFVHYTIYILRLLEYTDLLCIANVAQRCPYYI